MTTIKQFEANRRNSLQSTGPITPEGKDRSRRNAMALHDPKFQHYLPRAYEYWFSHFIDKEYGEVWVFVDGANKPMRQQPKIGQWIGAYHTFEHALVGYIVGQQLQAKPVTLYYAFPNYALPDFVQPYFYSGKITAAELQKDGQGRRMQKVIFNNVH
jgi:hypothetical protein